MIKNHILRIRDKDLYQNLIKFIGFIHNFSTKEVLLVFKIINHENQTMRVKYNLQIVR